MAEKGWIKLHRQLQDCPLWYCERFSKGQAWVDLLLMTNHADKKIIFNGKMMVVKRGQYLTSMLKLAEKWQWDRKTVKSFLSLLIKDNMISVETDNHRTLITIENYSVFQMSDDDGLDNGLDNELDNGITNSTDNTLDTRTDTNKNIKNDKNINNPPLSPLEGETGTKEKNPKVDYVKMIKDRNFDKPLEEVIIEWYRYKTEKRQTYKPTGFSKFLTEVQNNVNKYGVDSVVGVVNLSMANNWQGIVWDKLSKYSTQTKQSSSDVLSKYLNGGK